MCCTIFSLSGIVFLLGVSAALKSDSMYFLMEDAEDPKSSYADAVTGAMYIYLATMLISALFWVRVYTAPDVEARPPAARGAARPSNIAMT